MLNPGEKNAAPRRDIQASVAGPQVPSGLLSSERMRRRADGTGKCPAPAAAA